jgi:P-type Cu+ transporter
MQVNERQAAGKGEYQGETYYFCSKTCLDRFAADPGRYTGARSTGPAPQRPAAAAVNQAVEYTCPMHPEVRQTGPGACPKCGMALEPVTFSMPTRTVEYACPMHPQIVRGEPGFSPMASAPRRPSASVGRGKR